MAEFLVKKTLRIAGRNSFFVCGEMLDDGVVNIGDWAIVFLNEAIGVHGVINAIDIMDCKNRTESLIAIGIECNDEDEIGFWEGLNIGEDEILEIKPPEEN